METIYKAVLSITGTQTIEMPVGSEILDVQVQNFAPVLWYRCRPDLEEKVERIFYVISTGNPFPKKVRLSYIATFQKGGFVSHVFEDVSFLGED